MKVSILASAADHGTGSISAAFQNSLSPASILTLRRGFKRLRFSDFAKVELFLFNCWKRKETVVCLFNAPVLLGGLFPLPRRGRWVGVLDWNETLIRSGQSIPLFATYDHFYRTAFQRLSTVYSPSLEFIELYRRRGISIQRCDYPLPSAPDICPVNSENREIKVLFIGADYVRKGGDLLLEAWANRRPPKASLTFVSPQPPKIDIPGVNFLTGIKAGTTEQKRILETHDVFVLPTKKDAYGFALLEALNYGMSVITTSEAGAAHVVRDFGGIVSSSPEGAVSALMSHIENIGVIRSAREACRAYLPSYRARMNESLAEMLGTSDRQRKKE